MHTPLSAWLALSAAIIPGATAFYPYHYVADGDSSSQPSRRTFRPASNDNARPITLPLRRIATNLQSRENVYQIVASNKPSQENSVAIDQDGKDLSYMVAVTFGDSKEEYHMLLDSAASNTWVMGQDCKSEACKTHNLFGTGDSSSLKTDTSNFSITYGTGSSSGILASDTIHLGSLSSPLTFGLATNVSDEFRAYPMDGILGIGRGSGSEGDIHAPQIMDVLSSNHLINAKLYGIHLSRAKDGLKDGELDLGEVNKNRFTGDINYIDCVPNDTGFWEIPLQGASVDGTDVGLSSASRTAIMDTGTSYILVPKDDAVAIHSKIKGQTQNGETFFVPCDTASVVQFGFNGQKYNISAADWIGDNVDKTKNLCRSNIVGRQTFGAEQWLVGDVFLKNVYSVFDFDKSRVGLGVKGDEAETTSTDSSSGSPSNSPTASGSRAAAAAAPTTTSTEKAPQDQRGGSGAATAAQTSSSSIVALVVAIAAISMYI